MATSLTRTTGNGAPSPSRRDPFHTLREEMNELFDRAFSRPFGFFDLPSLGARPSGVIVPNVDIHETDKEIRLTAELPGVEEKDIDVTVHNGLITLKGEKRYERKEGEGDARVIERHYGSFERSFTLPTGVDEDGIAAKFDKGVLIVTLPKRPEAQSSARHIAIGKG